MTYYSRLQGGLNFIKERCHSYSTVKLLLLSGITARISLCAEEKPLIPNKTDSFYHLI